MRAAGFELTLPPSCAHWGPAIGARLATLRASLEPELARWPAAAPPPLRIRVCADPAEAAALLAALGLQADPRVPRTYPALGLAILPLPRRDALLTELSEPPATFLQSISHEAAHLLMAARPGLDAAPDWFLEGVAEAWRDGRPDLAAHAWILPLPAPGAVANESALDAWAAAALHSLAQDPGARPWESALPASAPAGAAPARGHRGREAHADRGAGRYLAASLPGEVVEVDLPALAPGERRACSLRLGRSGNPDGGLLLRPRGGPDLRVRCDSAGGLAAWTEDPARPAYSESSDRAGQLPADAPREFLLAHAGDHLLIQSGDFTRRLPIPPAARAYPVSLILYVRDGACAARVQP